MNFNQFIVACVVGAALFLFANKRQESTPTNFSVSQMSAEDRTLAQGFFAGMSKAIAYNGGKIGPAFTSDVDLINYRRRALDFTLQGGSFESKYPGFGNAVVDVLERHVGTEAKEFTNERRQDWIRAYDEVTAMFDSWL